MKEIFLKFLSLQNSFLLQLFNWQWINLFPLQKLFHYLGIPFIFVHMFNAMKVKTANNWTNGKKQLKN